MNRNKLAREGRTGRRGNRKRGAYVLAIVGVVLSTGPGFALAHARPGVTTQHDWVPRSIRGEKGPANPLDTLKAVRKSEGIQDKVLEIDGKDQPGERIYSAEFVQEIANFYKYGAGTAKEPGSRVVTREFARPYVIDLLWELLLVEERQAEDQSEPDPHRPQNPLNAGSEKRFRGVLTNLLLTCLDDLFSVDRIRLYGLVGKVFTQDDRDVVVVLEVLADTAEESDLGEDFLIARTLKQMRGN